VVVRLGRARVAKGAVALALAGLMAACGSQAGVLRVVDGRVVEGPYIPPEAYAAFLRGAIAADAGDARAALSAYVEASRFDDQDPEIWTRIAEQLCVLDPRDAHAEEALGRAFALDPAYAPAWGVRARCALARGDTAGAEAAAGRAVDSDPMADDLQLLLTRVERESRRTEAGGDAVRERLLALTLVHQGHPAAWEALAAWARVHEDSTLHVRAVTELARRAPAKRAELVALAVELAGEGDLSAARQLAAALVDAQALGVDAPASGARAAPLGKSTAAGLVARLAVDEALARGDTEKARLRATRTHLALAEVAGRALVLGDAALARALAAPVIAADPADVGARMVLAVATWDGNAASLSGAFAGASGGTDAVVPAPAALEFALLLARTVSAEEARRVLAATKRGPLLAGDALVTRLAVELAARGVLVETELPLDARVELAARRLETPPAAAAPTDAPLDARHALLAASLADPASSHARELMVRLHRARETDPVVAVAWVRILIASSQSLDVDLAARLLASDPGDPLIVVAALDLARKRGDAAVASRARASLRAVARTPAERARSVE